MRTKLLMALLCLFPFFVAAQNYEQQGDDLFAQAQYEKAAKKYEAAMVEIGSETPAIKQKKEKCSKCKALLTKAQTAEKESRYNDAAKFYSDLYAIHPLANYQSKANAMKQKVEQAKLAEQERQAKIEAERRAEQERMARERAEQDRLAKERAEQERLAKERANNERLARERAEQKRSEGALPNITLKDIYGKSVNIASLVDTKRPIIIAFFATWCKPCIREFNAIHKVYPRLRKNTGVEMYIVSIDKEQDSYKVKPFVKDNGWEYSVLLDHSGTLKRAMKVQSIPHTLILDSKGKIVYNHVGYSDGDEEEIQKYLK